MKANASTFLLYLIDNVISIAYLEAKMSRVNNFVLSTGAFDDI